MATGVRRRFAIAGWIDMPLTRARSLIGNTIHPLVTIHNREIEGGSPTKDAISFREIAE